MTGRAGLDAAMSEGGSEWSEVAMSACESGSSCVMVERGRAESSESRVHVSQCAARMKLMLRVLCRCQRS